MMLSLLSALLGLLSLLWHMDAASAHILAVNCASDCAFAMPALQTAL